MLERVRPYIQNHVVYINQFINSPKTFGTLAPSSSWLCGKMIAQSDWSKVLTIAELGAGTGVLTRRLLQMMPAGGWLDAYEIQPGLANTLKKLAVQDKRLHVLTQSAEQLNQSYDMIFSGLPLLSLPETIRQKILLEISNKLSPGGCYIQFQYTRFSEKYLSLYFDWTRVYELRNIPPAWVYYCTLK